MNIDDLTPQMANKATVHALAAWLSERTNSETLTLPEATLLASLVQAQTLLRIEALFDAVLGQYTDQPLTSPPDGVSH